MEGTLRGKERKQALAARALSDFERWLSPISARRGVIFRNVSQRAVTKRYFPFGAAAQ